MTVAYTSQTAGQTATTTITVTKPSGVTTGCQMVLFLQNLGTDLGAITLPDSTWSVLLARAASPIGATLYAAMIVKTAGASEPSSYTFTCANTPTISQTGWTLTNFGTPGLVIPGNAVIDIVADGVAPSWAASPITQSALQACIKVIPSGTGTSEIPGMTRVATENGQLTGPIYTATVSAGSVPVRTCATASSGGVGEIMFGLLIGVPSAPSTPTLELPVTGGVADLTSGANLTAAYNPTDAAPQSAYACRFKVSGAGAYSYWNATTGALQSTIVWNAITTAPGADWTVSIPSTLVSNGTTYNWSMASQESLNNLQGSFAADASFTGQAPPTVVVNGPTGVSATPQPTVSWTTTPAAGASQTAYRVCVYSAAQYSVGGFTPGSSPSSYDSGVIASSVGTAPVSDGLANLTTFRAYVQVTETGGITSTWQFASFSTQYDAPGTPTLTAVAGIDASGAPIVTLTVTGHDNLLSTDDASFEGSIGAWVNVAHATLARTAAWSFDGTDALSITSSSSGTTSCKTAAVAVTAGKTYAFTAVARAAATARAVTLTLTYLDVSNAVLATLTATGNDSTSANLVLAASGLAPAGTVTAQLSYSIAATASSEVHYLDGCGIFPGTNATWSRGGLAGAALAVITYPVGAVAVAVRGTANGVLLPAPDQTASVVDTEVLQGKARTYTATVEAFV